MKKLVLQRQIKTIGMMEKVADTEKFKTCHKKARNVRHGNCHAWHMVLQTLWACFPQNLLRSCNENGHGRASLSITFLMRISHSQGRIGYDCVVNLILSS